MRKLVLATFALTMLTTFPALADLGEVWGDFQSYSRDLQNYLRSNFNKISNSVEFPGNSTFLNASGEVNLPNPLIMGQNVYEALNLYSRSNRFENNSTIFSLSVGDEINRLVTLSSVDGILGINGQLRTKDKLKNTEKSLSNISNFLQQSDSLMQSLEQTLLGVTGTTGIISPLITSRINSGQANLQLKAVQIQGEQAKIQGEMFAQTIQIHQSLQYQNLNLANISQQIEVANRSSRVTSSAEAARLLRATSQINLSK